MCWCHFHPLRAVTSAAGPRKLKQGFPREGTYSRGNRRPQQPREKHPAETLNPLMKPAGKLLLAAAVSLVPKLHLSHPPVSVSWVRAPFRVLLGSCTATHRAQMGQKMARTGSDTPEEGMVLFAHGR